MVKYTNSRVPYISMAKSKRDNLKFSYALSLASQLGFLIVFSVVGFLWVGLWIDRTFSVAPWGVIGCVIIGVAMAVRESYQLVKPLLIDDTVDEENE